jgi:hypothetical protein
MVELSNWRLCLQTSGIYRDSAIPACNVKVKTGGAAAGCSPPRPGLAPEISAQVASLQSLILCSGQPQSKLPLNKLPTLNSEEALFLSLPNQSGSPVSRLLATVMNFCFFPWNISSTPI